MEEKTYVIKYGRNVGVSGYCLDKDRESVSYRFFFEPIKPMWFNDKSKAQEVADRLNDVFRNPRRKHRVVLKK